MKKILSSMLFLVLLGSTLMAGDFTYGYLKIVGKNKDKVINDGAKIEQMIQGQWADGAILYKVFYKKGFFVKKYNWVGIFTGPGAQVEQLVSGDYQGDKISELHIHLEYESTIKENQPPVGDPPQPQPPIDKPQYSRIHIKEQDVAKGVEFFKKQDWNGMWQWLKKNYYWEYRKHFMAMHRRCSIHLYNGDSRSGSRIVSRYF
ncbi:hypothetical protein ACFL35_11635 [Candidatus Riflebacteria bacterium]